VELVVHLAGGEEMPEMGNVSWADAAFLVEIAILVNRTLVSLRNSSVSKLDIRPLPLSSAREFLEAPLEPECPVYGLRILVVNLELVRGVADG